MSNTAVFWVTFSLAVITCAATVINYLFFRVHIDPHVVAYTALDEKRPTLILIVIENIGKGMAMDISFCLSESIPRKAFGLERPAEPLKAMDHGPLIDGIPALGPGAKRVITWGQFGGLWAGVGNRTVNVRCKYKSPPVGLLSEKWHQSESVLEVRSFQGIDLPTLDGAQECASHLKKIAETIAKLAAP